MTFAKSNDKIIYRFGKPAQYLVLRNKLFTATVQEIKSRPLTFYLPYINKWSEFSVKKAERYNRQINRVFRPYIEMEMEIRYKENYGSDFAAYFPGSRHVHFMDSNALFKHIHENNLAPFSFFFKDIYKPRNKEHEQAILNSDDFIYILPTGSRKVRSQFMYDLDYDYRYVNIEGIVSSATDNFKKEIGVLFREVGQRLLIEGHMVGLNFEVYDLLFWKEDISHLPYQARLERLKEFMSLYSHILSPRVYLVRETSDPHQAYTQLARTEAIYAIHKHFTYANQHGFYKIRRRVSLPFVCTGMTKVKRQPGVRRTYFIVKLGVYNNEGKTVTLFKVKVNSTSNALANTRKASYKYYLDKVWFVDVDEFYDLLDYRNIETSFDHCSNKHLESCNIYSHLYV